MLQVLTTYMLWLISEGESGFYHSPVLLFKQKVDRLTNATYVAMASDFLYPISHHPLDV